MKSRSSFLGICHAPFRTGKSLNTLVEDIIRPDFTRSHQEYQLFFQLLPLDLNAVRQKEAAALNEPPLGYVEWMHKTNLSHNGFSFPIGWDRLALY